MAQDPLYRPAKYQDKKYEELARKFPQGLAGLPQLPEELSGAVHATKSARK